MASNQSRSMWALDSGKGAFCHLSFSLGLRARVEPLFLHGRFDRQAAKFIDLLITKKRLTIER